MNLHALKIGDLIRGTYPDCSFRTVYLGIITDHDGDWLEITWNDGDIDQYDLEDDLYGHPIGDHWEVVSESR